MLAHETYVLHIYRSRAVRGWQWAARLEHLPDRTSRRFTDPEALLAHLRTLLQAGAPPNLSTDTPAGTDGLAAGPQDQGLEDFPAGYEHGRTRDVKMTRKETLLHARAGESMPPAAAAAQRPHRVHHHHV